MEIVFSPLTVSAGILEGLRKCSALSSEIQLSNALKEDIGTFIDILSYRFAHFPTLSALEACRSTLHDASIAFEKLWEIEAGSGNKISREETKRCVNLRWTVAYRPITSGNLTMDPVRKVANVAEPNSLLLPSTKSIRTESNHEIIPRILDSHEGYKHGDLRTDLGDARIKWPAGNNKYFILTHKLEELVTDQGPSIAEAHRDTVEWVFNDCGDFTRPRSTPRFLDWLNSGNGIYRIDGKAESSKSTLTNHIYQNVARELFSQDRSFRTLDTAVDLPTDSSFTENHNPQPTLPEPRSVVMSKLITKYANKLEKILSLRKNSDKRFSPAGTARDFFDDDRLRRLFKALFEVQKKSNRAADHMQEERIEKLITKVKGQGGSEGLFNTLATLVYIRYDGLILEYLEANSGTNPPFLWKTAQSFFGADYSRRFFHSQNIYTPFTFIEGIENKCCSAETARRLPILERKHKGSGAYGDVFDMTIKKGGWRFSDGSTNREPKRVAQKVFKGAFREEAQYAFLKEHDTHLQIREDPTSHKNLVHYLGSLEHHNNEYSLFFELTDRSLEDLLVCGGIKLSPAVIFACAASLCGDLDHLHHGLSCNSDQFVGYYLDFRPRNILIYGDLWKVADFGLSRFKHPRPGSEESPKATPNRHGDGAFVAPKASLKGVNNVSDLWSLGAVLIELITFAVGGLGLVQDFGKDHITAERHDRFFVERNSMTTVNEKVPQRPPPQSPAPGITLAIKKIPSRDSQDFKKEVDNLNTLRSRTYRHVVELVARASGWQYPIPLPSPKSTLLNYWNNDGSWSLVLWVPQQIAGFASGLHALHRFSGTTEFGTNAPLSTVIAASGGLTHGWVPSFSIVGQKGKWFGYHDDAKLENIVWPEEKFRRHNDLKPKNILWSQDWSELGEEGALQIVDFGLSRFHRLRDNSAGRARAALGTRNLSGNWISDGMLKGLEYFFNEDKHQLEEDRSRLAPNMGWLGWLPEASLRIRYTHRRLTWQEIDVWWQSKIELLLGSGSLKQPARLLKAFKSLLRVPCGGKRRPGRFSLLALPFVLTWVTPAAAELSVRENVGSPLRPSISSTYGDLHYEIQKFLLELVKPWQHDAETAMSLEALFVACFLCTCLTVLLFTVRRRDKYKKYFLAAGILLSTIVGAACSKGAQDFIFRYLFFGVNFSLTLSTFYHVKYSTRQNSSIKGWPASQKNSAGREFKHASGTFGDQKAQSI